MKTLPCSPTRPIRLAVAFLLTGLLALAGRAASLAPWPDGAVDFAGRAARNHHRLFGDENRAALDALNRELREASDRLRKAENEEARLAAAERGRAPAAQLLAFAHACPQRIRVDLTNAAPGLSPAGPFVLPGDSGAFLFEVQAGGSGVSYRTVTFDLEDPAGESSTLVANVAATGTTYVLAGVDHLPTGRNSLSVEFQRPDRPPVRLPLELTMPPPGRLKLTVLSDDNGAPAPAMVQLLWRADGNVHRPANGIEFAPQFDRQGRSTGARNANLPGPLADAFWCVPGPFDMMLSPGEWRIGVRRGVEHEVVFEDVTVKWTPLVGQEEREIKI